MTISVAFFLSDTGDVIHVPDNHIATVIRDPEKFGLTQAEIEVAYRKHGERIGVEGEARKQILLQIIADGWIRLRRYRQHWSVTAPNMSATTQERLRAWAEQMLSGTNGFKEADRYISVRVSTFQGETVCIIEDLANGSCPW